MTANDDENPHYDDLIRELRELKRFIEGNGEAATPAKERAARPSPSPSSRQAQRPAPDDVDPAPATPGSDPGPVAGTRQQAEETGTTGPATVDADDGPPTLREAVHRPGRRDELQLDLLSVSRPEDLVTDDDDAPGDEDDKALHQDSETPAPIASAPVAGAVVDLAGEDDEDEEDDGDSDHPSAAHALDEEDDDTPPGDDDEEVVRFVLDLSDRILDAIEDKLLEHSGELLPAEVRGELREAVGDILYEWCER